MCPFNGYHHHKERKTSYAVGLITLELQGSLFLLLEIKMPIDQVDWTDQEKMGETTTYHQNQKPGILIENDYISQSTSLLVCLVGTLF